MADTSLPVTDAMIEAGVCKLTDWPMPESVNCALCVEEIYTAMEAARTITSTAEGDELHPLSLAEVADQQFEEAIKASFRLGAQACREMMARFVDQGGYGDQNIVTSIRANWHPGWGDDPGRPNEIPRNALGDTAERDARHERFASRAVDHAMKLLDAEEAALTAKPSTEADVLRKAVQDAVDTADWMLKRDLDDFVRETIGLLVDNLRAALNPSPALVSDGRHG